MPTPTSTSTDSVVVITNPTQMFMAFDPAGVEVFCDFADQPAMTNDGHCQYCGSTSHNPLS